MPVLEKIFVGPRLRQLRREHRQTQADMGRALGVSAAYINLLGFAAMTFNFFVVNIVVAGLHSYAGLS